MNDANSEGKKIVAYLYDADGTDQTVDLKAGHLKNLTDKQILWITILERDEDLIRNVISDLQLKNPPIKTILNISERPKLDKFEDFYRFFISSVNPDKEGILRPIPIDYLVGKNFVITISSDEVEYFREFREREKGETRLGGLDTESFVASLLDLHIVSYFRALEDIERSVDKMDDRILKRDLEDEQFLREMVRLRRDVSKLRRWFLPHRDVFYALARPDFRHNIDSDSYENFQLLNQHFETAVDSIESSRDTVLSLFDLYTTKNAHRMNFTVGRLTFVTLIVGTLGVIAGIWGMNFEVGYFKSAETGFWLTIAAMGILTAGLAILAKFLRWI